MTIEQKDQPITRYEELCEEIYRLLHDLTFSGSHYSKPSEHGSIHVCGWHDHRQTNHGFSRSAYGFALQIIGESQDPLQESIHVRNIRIEQVFDPYHYKDHRWHDVARELTPKKSILGKVTFKWMEIPENVAHLRNNWLTQLREDVKNATWYGVKPGPILPQSNR